ncbi:MAG: hypothetical protein ACYTEQ_16530 [Planctomycetota bacterium]|jgi:hypothetical protein
MNQAQRIKLTRWIAALILLSLNLFLWSRPSDLAYNVSQVYYAYDQHRTLIGQKIAAGALYRRLQYHPSIEPKTSK